MRTSFTTLAHERRRFLQASAISVAAWAGLPAAALAQTRLKLATITTGFATGGSSDVIARILGDYLRGKYADAVVVENRVGASGRIAVEHVKGGSSDGSSLLVSPSGMMVLFPHIYKSLRYEPLTDFAPVTPLAKFPFVLTLSSLVPSSVQTLSDFIAWCKANPKEASFGSPGAGTSAHFAGIMLGRRANFAYTHVPYRGMAPLLQELMGGQLASGVLTPAEALPLMASGKLRLLATTGTVRSRFLPDVPTFKEAGYPDITIEESYSLYVPAAVAPTKVNQLAVLAHQMLALPDVQAKFAQMGLETAGIAPEQFKANLKALHERWGGIVKASGFLPTD